jgi:hypothetical protein
MSCKLKLAYDGQLNIFNNFPQLAYWSTGHECGIQKLYNFCLLVSYLTFLSKVFSFWGFQDVQYVSDR